MFSNQQINFQIKKKLEDFLKIFLKEMEMGPFIPKPFQDNIFK